MQLVQLYRGLLGIVAVGCQQHACQYIAVQLVLRPEMQVQALSSPQWYWLHLQHVQHEWRCYTVQQAYIALQMIMPSAGAALHFPECSAFAFLLHILICGRPSGRPVKPRRAGCTYSSTRLALVSMAARGQESSLAPE